jgi:hypothetical protein
MARRVSFCESSSKLPSKSVADNPRSPLPLLSQINISPLKVTSPVSQQILKLDYNEIANSGESFSNLHLNQFPDVPDITLALFTPPTSTVSVSG